MGTFLNMAGLALLLRALRRPSFLRFAGAGLVFGLAVLTVATVLSFALGAAIYVCYEIRKQNRSLQEQLLLPSALLLGLLVAIAPVTCATTPSVAMPCSSLPMPASISTLAIIQITSAQ